MIYSSKFSANCEIRTWFRFISVVKGAAYFQEAIDQANEMWVGNMFVCENKNLKITVVVDGQAEGNLPFIEVHNPTDKEVQTIITSPSGTPLFGGLKTNVKIPAGDSVKLNISGKQISY